MKLAPRIIASEVIRHYADISDAWKIAAVEQRDAMGNRIWQWFAPDPEVREIHERVTLTGSLSGCQGRQIWGGVERAVLYVRRPPTMAGRAA